MTTELDHLRAFRAAAAAPDDDARAAARARLLEEIVAAAPFSTSAAPPFAQSAPASAQNAPRRARRRPRLLAGIGGLALAGAAAIAIAVASGLGGGEVTPAPASAAALLREAADGSAAQQYVPLRAGQYWYVRSEVEALFGDAVLRRTVERWSGVDRQRERETIADEPRFFSEAARRAWIADGRPFAGRTLDGRGPVRATDDLLDVSRPLSPHALAQLPTAPEELRARIVAAARAQARARRLDPGAVARFTYAAGSRLLSQASAPVPPALRAALFRVLATVPGIELLGPADDARGRPGTLVGYTEAGTDRREELLIAPATGTLLERRIVLLRATPTSDAERGSVMPAGATFATTYVETAVVGSIEARP